MSKFLNKLLLVGASTLLFTNIANAKNTICYKNNWTSPSTIESVVLDGGECQGKYSVEDMKKKGWNVLDIKVETNENNINYSYLLSTNIANKDIQNSAQKEERKLSFKPFGVRLSEVINNQSTINIGNLSIGQSGIVMHIFDNDKKLIVANAEVIKSDANNSVIKFTEFNDIKQDAIPTSKRGVQKGDILVLNYLYTSSLLIAPNQETFQIVRSNFKYNNFLHSDLFAASLKYDEQPLPTKKDIKDFAVNQNLGTIFVVVNNKVNVFDSKSLKLLTTYDIDYDTYDSQFPFYTRVDEIKEGTFSFIKNFSFSNLNIFKDVEKDDYIDLLKFLKVTKTEKLEDDGSKYENYYKILLGLN